MDAYIERTNMQTVNTIITVSLFCNALYLAYLLGEIRESRRSNRIQDELTDKLVAAYRKQR